MSTRLHISLALALVVSGCGSSAHTPAPEPASAASESRSSGPLPHPSLTTVERDGRPLASIADIVEKALPSVVSIWSTRKVKSEAGPAPFLDDPLFRRFFGPLPEPPRDFEEQGLGSGVVVDGGYILTNNHVIERADEIRVSSPDKRQYKVKVVGADPKSDLAVLKVEGPTDGLVPLAMGDASSLRLGDVVIAIGNPFGLGQTVTMGIVSAKGRADVGIVEYADFIQTDAAINPGNSGGALINMRGELVGISTAILSRTGGNIGIGFAIPTNMARPIMTSLIEHGKVVRGWLGVSIQNVDADLAAAMNLPTSAGVLVTDVQPGSPAQAAGIERGDVILQVDGRPVNTTGELRNLIAQAGANVNVKLLILRKGHKQPVSVALSEMPTKSSAASAAPAAPGSGKDTIGGLTAEDLNALNRKRFGVPPELKSGVVITGVDPGSPVGRANLRPGDIVTEVNSQKIASVGELIRVWRASKGPILLLVWRGGSSRFVVIRR